MMLKRYNHFHTALEKRKDEGNLRTLKPKRQGADFYSNDYLGLARNKHLQNRLLDNILETPELLKGSSGSRLISGNSSVALETETWIAEEHGYESALLFSSGYQANLALFSVLATRHDTIIVDDQIHRSVHDGCKMSHARKLKFRHNDTEHLEKILKKQTETCYVAIESLYSMDGNIAPVKEIVEITEKYQAHLIVDEAHAFGVFGYGLIDRLNLQERVLATVITYGKALGTHGAAIFSRSQITSYLINFASPFIYTTSAHDFLWMSIREGYYFLHENPELSARLQDNIRIFRQHNLSGISSEDSPIQAIVIPDPRQLKTLDQFLQECRFLTYAIFSPTVKKGTERLRLCLHSFNTADEINGVAKTIREFL